MGIIKEEEMEIKFTKYTKAANPYDCGFKTWQLWGLFLCVYKKYTYQVHFSDTPSGCGPVQMYGYGDIQDLSKGRIKNFTNMLKLIIKGFYKLTHTQRTPVSISFVQGKWGKNISYFKKCMEDIGFEVKTYKNIAHGMNTRDIQYQFYLDLTIKKNVNLKPIE
jgi:hypothetical protein